MFDETRNFCLLRKFPPEGSKHARCNERTQLAKMAFTRLGHVWGYDPFNYHLNSPGAARSRTLRSEP